MIEEVALEETREPFSMERVEVRKKMTPDEVTAKARSVRWTPLAGLADIPDRFNPEVDNYCAPPPELEFHNAKDPNRVILHERPEHRMILFMKAQLLSNREIAKELGMSDGAISQITRQPWFRHALARRMEEAGGDILRKTLEGVALDCVYNLIDIANGQREGSKVADIRAANDSLLDRFLGKATQRVEQFDGGKVPTTNEIESLDRQLEETRQEVARLSGAEPQPKPATEVAQ